MDFRFRAADTFGTYMMERMDDLVFEALVEPEESRAELETDYAIACVAATGKSPSTDLEQYSKRQLEVMTSTLIGV